MSNKHVFLIILLKITSKSLQFKKRREIQFDLNPKQIHTYTYINIHTEKVVNFCISLVRDQW